VPFTDRPANRTSQGGFSSGIQVRFIDEDAAREDEGFINQLTMTRGEFSFSGENSILLGAELARSVNALPGDMVSLAFMTVKAGKASLMNETFTVRGLFRTGYYEYDRNMAFSSLGDPAAGDLENGSVLGIKLNHHFRDHRTLEDIRRAASLGEDEIVSWRNYNSAFFNALKIEKIFMLLVVGLIFIVVAVNIYHSMKRSVRERLEELALLKAMGGTPRGIRSIFLLQGAVIGLCGCFLGTVSGILISLNINGIMGFFINLIQTIRLMINSLTGGGLSTGSLFYFNEFPVQIMIQDLVVINAAALLSILAAALGSIHSYAAVNPADVFQRE
jgi:lipoprotein-releasing system permease protein